MSLICIEKIYISLIIRCRFQRKIPFNLLTQTELEYALILPDSSSSNGKNTTLYLIRVYSLPSFDMYDWIYDNGVNTLRQITHISLWFHNSERQSPNQVKKKK